MPPPARSEAIVANRVKGIRCALRWNEESARLGRQHNNANMLSIGQRMMSLDAALADTSGFVPPLWDGTRLVPPESSLYRRLNRQHPRMPTPRRSKLAEAGSGTKVSDKSSRTMSFPVNAEVVNLNSSNVLLDVLLNTVLYCAQSPVCNGRLRTVAWGELLTYNSRPAGDALKAVAPQAENW
jgi:hypothetical protein